MQPVNIGILGLGTVGCGTVNVLRRNAEEISRRAGREIQITQAAVANLNKQRNVDLSGIELTGDANVVVNNPDIDIVVELVGGEDYACDLVLQAIKNKKHVITANKALIAKHGNEIFAAASEQRVIVAFEAAVAGGIPIIKAIREGLSGNRIEWIAGIINGTCNYILTAMQQQGRDFDEILQEAQSLGYAEADPSFDIDGIDVAHKLTILASIAFGIPLQFDQVHIEGIRNITAHDITYAKQLGYCIKHLGIAKRHADGIEIRVHPTFIPEEQTIAHVNGVMNALLVQADAVGSTLYYGAGAGAEPTASAVVADIVDVVRTMTVDPEHRVPHLAFQPGALHATPVLPITESECASYLRLRAKDKPGVLANVTKALGEQNISIESILQLERDQDEGWVPIVIITHKVKDQHLNKAIKEIAALDDIGDDVTRVRLELLEEK